MARSGHFAAGPKGPDPVKPPPPPLVDSASTVTAPSSCGPRAVLAHPDDESLATGGVLAHAPARIATSRDRHPRRARPLRRRRRVAGPRRGGPRARGRAHRGRRGAGGARGDRAGLSGRCARPGGPRGGHGGDRRPPAPRAPARGHHVRPRGRVRPHRSHRDQPADRGGHSRARRTLRTRRPGRRRTACRSSISSRGARRSGRPIRRRSRRSSSGSTARSASRRRVPAWALTTIVDYEPGVAGRVAAVSCHKTQMSIYARLGELPGSAPSSGALGALGVLPGVQPRESGGLCPRDR
jgi:hypothetical protein